MIKDVTSSSNSSINQHAPTLFKAGMLVTYHDEVYQIRNAEADYMVLQHTVNKAIQMVSTEAWSSAYCGGALTLTESEKVVAMHPITDAAKLVEAERMLAYLNELDIRRNFGSEATRLDVINYISQRIKDLSPPHHMQLYRMYKRWQRAGKNIQVLLSTKQTRTKPITGMQLDFALYIIDEHYLVPHGGNRSELYRIFCAEFYKAVNQNKFQLTGKSMSKTALDNILDTLDPFQVYAAQKGISAARAKFRDSNEKIATYFPGERVEVDAVHLNLGVLDDATGEYIGKVIVFLAIDVHTRYILGYSIVYGTQPAESAEAVINLLRHVVTPKFRNGNYSHEWYTLGAPGCIHADNGPGFISETVLRFCAMLNTDLHRSESRKSQRRPFIERFNRTLREQLMTKIPGYLGKRVDEASFNKTIEQAAVVKLSEFTRDLEEFIVDYYNQNPHKGLGGMTPAQKLEECKKDFFPRPAPDIAKMNALIGVTRTSTIQATHGIQIKNLHYHSTELKSLRFRLMKNRKTEKSVKVDVIFNRQDISSVTVLVPDAMEMLIVPLRDKTIEPGTTLAEYQARQRGRQGSFEQQEYKPFPSKHKQHRAPRSKAKGPNPGAVKSNAVTHDSYDLKAALQEGIGRLAQDDTQRNSAAPSSTSPPAVSHSESGRKRSKGR